MSVPAAGTQIGSYRLEALLGRGGMGMVYRAEDLRLGRKVALKLLASELTEDASFRERFLAESRLAASIDNAGIVPIYEAGEADGQLYIAMRYVEGTDLAGVLRRDGPLAPERAVDLVSQLGDALDAAHQRGLVHRDVKPSNALIAVEGGREHVYLADFGVTKRIAATADATASGQLVGTMDYLAPESIRAEPADGRADLYSLGCVLFECLTGEVPFPRESDVASLYAHLEDDPPRASERRAGLPRALDAVVDRALAKDPEDRWQTGAELAAAARAALTPGGPSPAEPERRRRRPPLRVLLAAAAAVGILTLLAVLTLGGSGGGGELAIADADAVAVIDPGRGELVADVRVGASPSQMAASADALWVANTEGGTVSRIDRHTRAVTQTVTVGGAPSAVAVGAGGVWVANGFDGTLSWISPVTKQLVYTTPVGNGPSGVCTAAGAVWVASSDDRRVVRFDPVSRRKSALRLDDQPTQLACGGGSVWATSQDSGTVTQLAARGRGSFVRTIAVGGGASGVAWGHGAVWVANSWDGTVSRVDGRTGVPTAVIRLGARAHPTNVAVGADGVWVSDELAGTVARIDPGRDRVVKTLTIGNRPQGLAVVDGSLWVSVRATGARHRGGTLRVVRPVTGPPDEAANYDPAQGYNGWEILPMTNDGLVAFDRAGGRRSAAVVPDLAATRPAITDGGRTYAFQLRRGVRYSTGATVRASHIRHGLERVLRKGVLTHFYTGIRGARRCVARPARCDLSSGVEVNDAAGTITFHLTRPDPEFLFKLALPGAVAVPPGIGIANLRRPVPATGPYMIAEIRRHTLRLVRNPHFRATGARPDGYPDVIAFDYGSSTRAGIRAVQQGRADFVGGDFGLDSDVRRQLDASTTRYAGQLHTTTRPTTSFAFLNTSVAPFDNADARRALNYAVDRGAFVALRGGERFAAPTCQFLPANFPGYRPYCPYTARAGPGRPWSAPDLTHARGLVARSHTRGMRVTVVGPAAVFDGDARLLRDVLDRLGYRARLRLLPEKEDWIAYVQDSRHRAQIGPVGWGADYPSALAYLQPVFSCAAFVPGTPSQTNASQFCDATVDRFFDQSRGQPPGTAGSDALLAKAERRIVDQAAALPLVNPKAVALVSRRVGNYQYSQQEGVLYDQLWVR